MVGQVATALPTITEEITEEGDGAWPDDARVREVCRFVNERYRAFGKLQETLKARSALFHRRAVRCKVFLIVLGALSATNGGNQLMDSHSRQGTVTFALLGAAIAIAAGLDAAFKPEKVGGELAGLAAECVSTRGLIELTWDKVLLVHSRGTASGNGRELALKNAEDLLERLSIKLNEVYARAATLGVQPDRGDYHLPQLPARNPILDSRRAGQTPPVTDRQTDQHTPAVA